MHIDSHLFMRKMDFILIFLVAWISFMPTLGIVGFEQTMGVTTYSCYLQHLKPTSKPCLGMAQIVNITQSKVPTKRYSGIFQCAIIGPHGNSTGYAQLELVTNCSRPYELSLQIGNIFLPQLESAKMDCDYNWKSEALSQGRHRRIHFCEVLRLKLITVGTGHRKKVKRSAQSKRSHEGTLKLDNDNIPCAEFYPESVGKNLNNVGVECFMKGNRSGRIMLNEAGDLDCLWCCPNHYWNIEENVCRPCPAGTNQPYSNPWTRCKVITQERPKPTLITEAPITSTHSTRMPLTSPIKGSTSAQEKFNPSNLHETAESMQKNSGLVGTPTRLHFYHITSSSAKMSWQMPALYGTDIGHFEVSVLANLDSLTSTVYKTSQVRNNFTLSELKPKTCYDIRVRAVNNAGRHGNWSKSYELHTQQKLVAPLNVRMENNKKEVTIDWDVKDDEKNLRVKVDYCRSDMCDFVTLPVKEMGRVQFILPGIGQYTVTICYVYYHEMTGPLSEEFLLEYEEDSGINSHWLVIGAIVIFFAVLVGCLCWEVILRKRRSKTGTGI